MCVTLRVPTVIKVKLLLSSYEQLIESEDIEV